MLGHKLEGKGCTVVPPRPTVGKGAEGCPRLCIDHLGEVVSHPGSPTHPHCPRQLRTSPKPGAGLGLSMLQSSQLGSRKLRCTGRQGGQWRTVVHRDRRQVALGLGAYLVREVQEGSHGLSRLVR